MARSSVIGAGSISSGLSFFGLFNRLPTDEEHARSSNPPPSNKGAETNQPNSTPPPPPPPGPSYDHPRVATPLTEINGKLFDALTAAGEANSPRKYS